MAWLKDPKTKGTATETFASTAVTIDSGETFFIKDSSGDTVASFPDSDTGTIILNAKTSALDFNVRG